MVTLDTILLLSDTAHFDIRLFLFVDLWAWIEYLILVSCGPTTDRSHNVGQNSKFLSSSFDASPSLLRFPYTSLLFLSAVKLSCGAELNYTNIAGRFHSHSL